MSVVDVLVTIKKQCGEEEEQEIKQIHGRGKV
jgi:hypothetical protein